MDIAGTDQNGSKLDWRNAETDNFPLGLGELIAANERLERDLAEPSDHEIAQTVKTPLGPETVFANFGLMLGIFPPATFFLFFLLSLGARINPLVVALLLLTNATTAFIGYHSGKLIAKLVRLTEGRSLPAMIALSIPIGALWGVAAGGVGSVFLFIIGSIFGAAIGGVIGAVALPMFIVPYLAVKRGGVVGLSHFLPMSAGVTAIVCAYVLHLLIRSV